MQLLCQCMRINRLRNDGFAAGWGGGKGAVGIIQKQKKIFLKINLYKLSALQHFILVRNFMVVRSVKAEIITD